MYKPNPNYFTWSRAIHQRASDRFLIVSRLADNRERQSLFVPNTASTIANVAYFLRLDISNFPQFPLLSTFTKMENCDVTKFKFRYKFILEKFFVKMILYYTLI